MPSNIILRLFRRGEFAPAWLFRPGTFKDRIRSAISNTWPQYRHYRRCFPGDVLFSQVGGLMEFYQPDDAMLARRLGLEAMVVNRRRARFGFPAAHTGKHLLAPLKAGRSIAMVAETGRRLDKMKERLPVYRFECRDHRIS